MNALEAPKSFRFAREANHSFPQLTKSRKSYEQVCAHHTFMIRITNSIYMGEAP
jgi:hypothetical protein